MKAFREYDVTVFIVDPIEGGRTSPPRERAFAAHKLAMFFANHYQKEIDSLIAERDLRVSDSTRILAELLLIRALLEKREGGGPCPS